MPLSDDLDFAGNADDVDKTLAGGNRCPEGFHHAVVTGYREANATQTGNVGRELTFKVVAGPGKGKEVKQTFWRSDKENGKLRLLAVAHRLGLIRKVPKPGGGTQFEPVPGKDWPDCRDQECVIKVKHRPDTYVKDGQTRETVRVELDWDGLFTLGDPNPKVKAAPRGSKADVQAALSGGALPPADDLGDM